MEVGRSRGADGNLKVRDGNLKLRDGYFVRSPCAFAAQSRMCRILDPSHPAAVQRGGEEESDLAQPAH